MSNHLLTPFQNSNRLLFRYENRNYGGRTLKMVSSVATAPVTSLWLKQSPQNGPKNFPISNSIANVKWSNSTSASSSFTDEAMIKTRRQLEPHMIDRIKIDWLLYRLWNSTLSFEGNIKSMYPITNYVKLKANRYRKCLRLTSYSILENCMVSNWYCCSWSAWTHRLSSAIAVIQVI